MHTMTLEAGGKSPQSRRRPPQLDSLEKNPVMSRPLTLPPVLLIFQLLWVLVEVNQKSSLLEKHRTETEWCRTDDRLLFPGVNDLERKCSVKIER